VASSNGSADSAALRRIQAWSSNCSDGALLGSLSAVAEERFTSRIGGGSRAGRADPREEVARADLGAKPLEDRKPETLPLYIGEPVTVSLPETQRLPATAAARGSRGKTVASM